jgi:hexosaminidase
MKLDTGSFELSVDTIIEAPRASRGAADAARYLAELWRRTNGMMLALRSSSADASTDSLIRFERHPGYGPEAYRLEVAPHRIIVSASTATGLFYGAITLWQLMPPGAKRAAIAAQTINDEPRYAWRGLMLDSARHFQSPAFIRSMIDWMAWHKLNELHWHLTDDQGWRLQIRKYPKLTSVGAWRLPATIPGAPNPQPYGGFYTQAQVRSIVAFASTRHVRIVPEIEMPGHAQAAIAAYPGLGAVDGHPPLPVSARWGVHSHLFNLEPGTFEFLKNVLNEVMELFPSRYIHIGGDEAVKDEWIASHAVQARARQLGITDPNALQTYFTQTLSRYLSAKGRRAVGWDEILQPGLGSDAVIMSWHGTSGAHAAAIKGNDTVLAPDPTLYLDHRQSALPDEPPGRLAIISLKNVYDFEPADPGLSPAQQRHVLGIEAQLWTEHIQSEARIEWMALPRAAALAEVAWSSAPRNWPDFLERLLPMFVRYRVYGLDYADSAFGIRHEFAGGEHGIRVTLGNLAELDQAALGTQIHYTLDGREPRADSAHYAQPLELEAGAEISAATFLGSQQASRTWRVRLDEHSGSRRFSTELEPCGNGVGLLLEPDRARRDAAPLAVDIMNPCWIDRAVDLTRGPQFSAAVAPLPFNYELGADTAHIRIGDSRTPAGELEVHVDGCETPAVAALPLAAAAGRPGVSILPAAKLPALTGRHDLCLRFARPHLDPLWALDWAQIGE